MPQIPDEKNTAVWQRRAYMLFVLMSVGVLGYLALRYLSGVLLPFLIAWAVGLLIHPLAVKLGERLRLPKKLCAAVLVILLTGLIVLLFFLCIDRLIRELRGLLYLFESDDAAFLERLERFRAGFSDLASHIPLLNRLWQKESMAGLREDVNEWLKSALQNMISDLSSRIPAFAGALVRHIPSFFVFLVVCAVSCFYFSLDLDKIHTAVLSCLPAALAARLPALRRRVGEILRQYARAYLLILTMTFLELYLALTLLGVEYALLIAFLTALIDILPILGIGLVLLPWSVFCLFTRQFSLGLGLLITYVIMTVIREVIEPRVVSGSLGLHPLLTLAAMYAGLRLFGVFGMLLSPIVLLTILGSRKEAAGSLPTNAPRRTQAPPGEDRRRI